MKKYLLVIPVLAVLGAGVFLLTATKTKIAQENGCYPGEQTGQYDYSATQAFFEGQELDAPLFARNEAEEYVLGVSDSESANKWIEVDLSEQKLRAWDGNALFLESPVSTGLPQTPTPTGEFRIWIKLRYTRMQGGAGRGYYNLPNVPYTMFLESENVPRWRGYGIHGTYWHNHFGTPRSHGCINLPTPIAEKVYYWASPVLPEGSKSTSANDQNPGTRVLIHE